MFQTGNKSALWLAAILLLALAIACTEPDSETGWPVLKTYSGVNLDEVAMPLGGIGTGTVSLGERGDLRDWEIMNRGALGYLPYLCALLSDTGQPRSGPGTGGSRARMGVQR